MKKEGDKPYTGIITSKWSMFLNSVFQYLQRDFDRKRGGYIDKKGIVAEIRKEIFSENDRDTPAQTFDVPIIPVAKPAQKWIDPNARKPGEHFRTWGARLRKRYMDLVVEDPGKPKNLYDCKILYHDLMQYDLFALPPSFTKLEALSKDEEDKHDPEAGPGPVTQANREKANNEEFRRLGEITDEQERDLEFRKQKELGMAFKRRAIAVHHAKVPRFHPDNESNI